MIVYYNNITGKVKDVSDELSYRRLPLQTNESYLRVPNNKVVYEYATSETEWLDDLVVNNGVLEFKGNPVFTLTEMQEYYENLLLSKVEDRLHLFRLAQVWYLQLLIDYENAGNILDYPYQVYNLNTGNVINVNNTTQLNNFYGVLASNATNHLGNILGAGPRLKQILDVTEISDFMNIRI